MNESFKDCNDSAIFIKELEIPATLVWAVTHIFTYVLRRLAVKRRYAVYCQRYNAVCDRLRHENQTGDRMTSRKSVPSPYSELSNNKSLNSSIGYIGEVCYD